MPNPSCETILQWLKSMGENVDPEGTTGAICARFVERASRCGFSCEMVRLPGDGIREYEVRWAHFGSVFVGFKQPPPQPSADDALLVGCEALLANDWCRARLRPGG